jgi:beta-lactamase class A
VTEQLAVIEATLRGGILGVAARFLPTNETVSYNAPTVFPTASVIKVAIVAELFAQGADLDQPITVQAEDIVAGSGVLAHLTPGLTLPLRDLMHLTISVSDNTASNLCLKQAGGKDAVNARMRETWGMTSTEIHRPIRFELQPCDPPSTATGTPEDFLNLLVALQDNEPVRQLLRRTQDDSMLPRYLSVNPFAPELHVDAPPFVVEHKTGAVTGVRNDVGLLWQGEKCLALSVFTKGTPDPRWTPENLGTLAVAQVSRLLCERFFG